MHKQEPKSGQDRDAEMLRYPEAARITGLALPTLYSKVSRKEIPHYRLGRRLVVFKRAELAAWMNERRVSPSEPSPAMGGTK